MSTNVKMDPHEIRNTQNKQSYNKHLVCGSSRNYTAPVRPIDKILNKKEHMESCLKLLKFVDDSELTLTQVNGQRKLGPPSTWIGPPPSPKCEIFVGNIPRNYYEPEIVKIFNSVGQIYELRLMMDFSGRNRGYCFIMYTNEEEAVRAVKELDQFEIYPGKRIGVVASVNNRRLHIDKLFPTIDTETIVKRFYEITDDIESVAVYRNLSGYISYVFVSYNTHRGAAMGRRRLVPESLTLFPNCEVVVEWAKPNMTPSNVFEERGTCNKAGKVEIKSIYLMPVKPMRSITRLKHSIEAVSKNIEQNPNCLSNPSTFEQSKSHNLAGRRLKQNDVQVSNVDGNLGNTMEQSLLYENLKKNYVQHQQNMTLPSISAFLKKRKNFKVNEARRYTNEPFGHNQVLVNNPSDATSIDNNHPLNCACHFRSREKSLISENVNLDWNSVQNLMSKISRVLLTPNENKSQVLLLNNVDGTPNVAANQALVPSNRSFANHYHYGNYSQNYHVNSIGQNCAMTVRFPDQLPPQCNDHDARWYMLKPNREHLSQQFLSGNANSPVPSQNADWCYSSSIPDVIKITACRTRRN